MQGSDAKGSIENWIQTNQKHSTQSFIPSTFEVLEVDQTRRRSVTSQEHLITIFDIELNIELYIEL